MADTGKTGGIEGASMNGQAKGWGWRTRTALAGVLRLVPFFATMVLMVILWDACGGGLFPTVTSSSSATGGTGTPTPGSGSFFYVTNFAAGNVGAYRRNATTGALSLIGTVPAGPVKGPVGLVTAATPTPFIYVANSAGNDVYQYSISLSGGGLTSIPNGHVAAGTAPQWVAVTPAGTFAYATNFGTNTTAGSISQYTIDSTTGALTANTPPTVTASILHPSGAVATDSFLYVTDQGNEDIVSYSISGTGTLQLPSTISLGVGGAPGPVIIDASTLFAYATDTNLGLVYAFQITNSGLSLINSYSSIAEGVNASMGLTTVITSQQNEYLYVANEASDSITEFQVANLVGTLTQIATYSGAELDSPTGVAATTDQNTDNAFLYVTNQGNGTITFYSIDSATGALALSGTLNIGNGTTQPMFPLIAF
jgi:6-phosphogluconolactonase (cycloisomerase 2 family)